MQSSASLWLLTAVLCAAASPSPANVTISNAATSDMTCSGGVCSPTAANAVLNVRDLEAILASGNATVTTTGSGVQAVNIRVNARLAWSAATRLSLDAFQAIEITDNVTVAGTGAVALMVNDGGSGGDFACKGNGRLEFDNLSGALSINDTLYTLVNSVASLASAIAAKPSVAVALAENYNAKKDGTYTSSPIATVFSGSFNGLGNTISNLAINDATEYAYVGLFAQTATGSAIANVHLVNENVRGGLGSVVGGLVASANGVIVHSFNSGTVNGGDDATVGGLLGNGSVVAGSGSSAAVSGGNAGGGLIAIANSYSGASISDSWATGDVSGSIFVGGLVGYDRDVAIKHSWASGQVSGIGTDPATGGLVGIYEGGSIERSYASGAVSCTWLCGGLVGWLGDDVDAPKISQSYATGTVTAGASANRCAGGLVGWKELGEVSNSYASGAVTAGCAGGLVGENDGDPYNSVLISNSYATGAVKGIKDAGGFIGSDYVNGMRHTYWDTTTSGITNPGQGAGNFPNVPGIKGLSNKKLKSGLPKGFNPKIWKEDSSINGGLPYLVNNPPPN